MFQSCPTKMLLTLRLNCPSQVGYIYNRPVCFQVQLVCVYGLSGSDVLVLNHNRPGSSPRQDNYSIGQGGKCDQQAVEIPTGRFPTGLSQDPDTELWRVDEISNIFYILLIH